MLVSPRIYSLAQTPDRAVQSDTTTGQGSEEQGNKKDTSRVPLRFHTLLGWRIDTASVDAQRAARMLLVHQTGSVKVGDVVRYATPCSTLHFLGRMQES